jgi:hypothetical protein
MKNHYKLKAMFHIVGITAIIAVIGFSMVACDSGSGGDDGNSGSDGFNPFVGLWTLDSNGRITATVTETTWTARYNTSVYNSGTYTYKGNNATFKITNKGQGSEDVGFTFPASISGNKMIISTTGSMNGTYTKDGGNTPSITLDGLWKDDSGVFTVRINGSIGTVTQIDKTKTSNLNALMKSFVDKNYVKVGDQYYNGLRETSNLKWNAYILRPNSIITAPNVATGTMTLQKTITVSANGNTFNDTYTTWTKQ